MDVVLRAVIIYVVVFGFTRALGRRELSSLQPFDRRQFGRRPPHDGLMKTDSLAECNALWKVWQAESAVQLLNHYGSEQGHHDLVMADQRIAMAAFLGRPLNHIRCRAVVG